MPPKVDAATAAELIRKRIAAVRTVGSDPALAGIAQDLANATAKGEAAIHAASSRTQLWIMPTNEELVVARQAKALLEKV